MAGSKPSDRARPRERVTGLRLPQDLVKELKHIAIDSERTFRETFSDAIREYIAKYKRRS
jgi:metal-responsive CopG/Arc/MetJ family transcriptional regulator